MWPTTTSRLISAFEPSYECANNVSIVRATAPLTLLDQRSKFLRNSTRLLTEVEEVIGDECAWMGEVLRFLFRVGVKVSSWVLLPSAGFVAEVDVVATPQLPISFPRLLRNEPRISVIIVEAKHLRHSHRIDQTIAIRSGAVPEEPVALS
jgi:hypothetical protein